MGKVLGREVCTATPQTQTLNSTTGMIAYSATTPVVTFWGSVQPVGKREVELLPEGSRDSALWIIYTEGVPALVENTRYRITCSKGVLMPVGFVDLSVHAHGLPHLAPVCREVGADE